MTSPGGEELGVLARDIGGGLFACLSGDVTGVLSGGFAGAGRGWLGACGDETFSGPAGKNAKSTVNRCNFLAEDQSYWTYRSGLALRWTLQFVAVAQLRELPLASQR